MTRNIEKKRGPEDCRFYNSCSASLCPLDSGMKEMIWCPEENQPGDICRNPEFRNMRFIRTQKKIAKAVKKRSENRNDFFTFAMLDRDIIIRRGIKGLNPDVSETVKDPLREYKIREERWLKKHPEISEQKIESMRERGRKSLGFIQKPLSRPSIFESDYPGYDNTHLDVDTSKKSSENGGIGK
ncbi:MAG: hypothetical protein QXU98_04010 [Candidatus Parvarchaeota archaeon]